jgi:hypothetical protein
MPSSIAWNPENSGLVNIQAAEEIVRKEKTGEEKRC